MQSLRLWLALPRFLWRGKWFWGAWLLVFLLPQTRDEARLHFVGSRFVPRLYGQPYQEDHMAPYAPTSDMTALEAALWKQSQGVEWFSANSSQSPRWTLAGRLSARFGREKWLHAAALSSALGYDGSALKSALTGWALAGEKLDPGNALYPLVVAKAIWQNSKKQEGDAALERAAKCRFFDDGLSQMKRVWLRAARKGGMATWSEKSGFLMANRYDDYARQQQLFRLAQTLFSQNQHDKKTGRLDLALKRSVAMMRVSLLLQSGVTDASHWSAGADFARRAWSVAVSAKALASTTTSRRSWFGQMPTVNANSATFEAFARGHKRLGAALLARRTAARVRLLAPYTTAAMPYSPIPRNAPLLTPAQGFWTMVAHPAGFGVLAFGAYLLGWWWAISAFLWGTRTSETPRSTRTFAPVLVVLASATGLFWWMRFLFGWMNDPKFFAAGPGSGTLEMFVFWGLLLFLAPPLFLALWNGVRTTRLNRAALRLPARLETEMNLAPLERWVLTRATSAFLAAFLALALFFAGLWLFLRSHGLVGYDWLRAIAPGVSTRLISPTLTSLEAPTLPVYSALCLFALLGVWVCSWRWTLDAGRRAIFHGGLRAWKDSLAGALTATVWVYFGLLLALHVVGNRLESRAEAGLSRGAGIFVRGFYSASQ